MEKVDFVETFLACRLVSSFSLLVDSKRLVPIEMELRYLVQFRACVLNDLGSIPVISSVTLSCSLYLRSV